jgi:hypothetical protein
VIFASEMPCARCGRCTSANKFQGPGLNIGLWFLAGFMSTDALPHTLWIATSLSVIETKAFSVPQCMEQLKLFTSSRKATQPHAFCYVFLQHLCVNTVPVYVFPNPKDTPFMIVVFSAICQVIEVVLANVCTSPTAVSGHARFAFLGQCLHCALHFALQAAEESKVCEFASQPRSARQYTWQA